MWVGFLVILIASAAITAVGWYGWQEKLPRQHFAGIRTKYTMANDEQWKAVHRLGAPYMIFGGVAAFAASLAMLPFALFTGLPQTFAAAVLLAIAILIAGTGLMAWQLGVRAAKAQLGS
jgi:uncharacterized membrane protein